MNKQIATALVGFCHACQSAHIREHVGYDKELKQYYCKRTNAHFYDRFHPPIPVTVDENEVNDPAFSFSEVVENETPQEPLSIKSMVPMMLEDILLTAGIDNLERHRKEIDAMIAQIYAWMDQALQPEQQTMLLQSNILRPFGSFIPGEAVQA